MALRENRQHQKEILEILVRDWNPSALPEADAMRQFEGYVPDIYRFLLARDRKHLAGFLYDKDSLASEADRFDSTRWAAVERVADRLLSLEVKA